MKPPWPRRAAAFSGLALLALLVASALRSPWPEDDFKGLRDSVSDHGAMLSAGHSSLGQGADSCVFCHFPHQTKAMRPLWLKEGKMDAAVFGRDSLQAGGAQTGLCLSCHDGTVAPALRAHLVSSTDAGRHPHVEGSGNNHPVGVDYLTVFRLNPDAYNDPTLNPKIVLEEGKVGCVSCHATHDLSLVSAGNVRHEVCIECHRR